MTKKIRTIKEFAYKAIFNFGEITKGNRLESMPGDNRFFRYNKNGELVEEGYFTRKSNFECSELYRICEENEQGQIVLEASYVGNMLLDINPHTIIKNTYNNRGKLIKSLTYKKDKSNFSEDSLAILDSEGNITPPKTDLPDPILVERTINKYDDDNNLIESREFDRKEHLIYKETWVYDNKGLLIERTEYETEEEIDTKYVYTYDDGQFDDKIRLLGIKHYNSNNILIGETFCIHDDQGRIIDYKVCNDNGIIVDRSLFNYYDDGDSQEVHYLDSDGNIDHKMVYKYNLNNSLLEEGVYNPDGSLYSRHSNIFDEKERIIESRWVEFAEEFVYTSSKYKYDENGNWIRCIEFEKEIPVKIIEREIEYY